MWKLIILTSNPPSGGSKVKLMALKMDFPLLLIFHFVIATNTLKSLSSFGKESQLTVVGVHGNYTWPVKDKAIHTQGDLILGALHMVHERSDDQICGPIMPQGGVQALETMLYTLDVINADQKLLPGITLGVLAKDDCDRDIYGLEQAVDFIRGELVLFLLCVTCSVCKVISLFCLSDIQYVLSTVY